MDIWVLLFRFSTGDKVVGVFDNKKDPYLIKDKVLQVLQQRNKESSRFTKKTVGDINRMLHVEKMALNQPNNDFADKYDL